MPAEDRRIRKTRKAIDDACWSLLKEKKFEDISISDIANRADINRATFYRYYVDKYGWLDHQFDILLQELEESCAAVYAAQDPASQQKAFLESHRHFDRNFDIYYTLISNSGGFLFLDRFTKMQIQLLKKIAMKNRKSSTMDDFYMHYIASSVTGIVRWWIENNRPITVEQLTEQTLSLHRNIPWNSHSHAE